MFYVVKNLELKDGVGIVNRTEEALAGAITAAAADGKIVTLFTDNDNMEKLFKHGRFKRYSF